MIKKIIAFTLAEVLLVVAVIGVVAALSIPNLKRSYDEKALASKGKATMAKLDAAISQADMTEALSKGGLNNVSKALLDDMAQYLKLTANCGNTASGNYCFTKDAITNGKTLSNFDPVGNGNCASAILNDGTEFSVCVVSKTPAANGNVLSDGKKYYGYIAADVNGAKNIPNKRAGDVYFYIITEGGTLTLPDGTNQAQYEINTFKTGKPQT